MTEDRRMPLRHRRRRRLGAFRAGLTALLASVDGELAGEATDGDEAVAARSTSSPTWC